MWMRRPAIQKTRPAFKESSEFGCNSPCFFCYKFVMQCGIANVCNIVYAGEKDMYIMIHIYIHICKHT